MNSERRSCLEKVRHEKWWNARAALRSTMRAHNLKPGELVIYQCRFCHGWHVGHPRPEHLRIRRIKRK
ncbi:MULTISPECIES: hypothetical protein [Acidobacterium]|uniref:hypothetical protein n=1 Tax=Acidobacterium TaxID=33973 RepID=UPI00030D004B|nr:MULTISPECIES: hypothetical protein [Acidobacterium]HCT62084.1 hypothetical protein [Acidobacterium sp.]